MNISAELIMKQADARTEDKVETVRFDVRLKKGTNIIRLGNAHAWCPDIDKMEIQYAQK